MKKKKKKEDNTRVHIGDEIRNELTVQERPVAWLANKLTECAPNYLIKQLNKRHLQIPLYILFFVFISCSSSNRNDPLSFFKEPPIVLKPIVIDTDKPVLLGGEIAMITDSILAVITPREDTLLTLISIPTGKIIKRIIPRGQGPEEMIVLFLCAQSNKNELWINDPNQSKICRLDMEAVVNESYRIEPTVRLRSSDLLKIDDYFVGAGSAVKDNRFQIFDSQGNFLTSCLHYKKPDNYYGMPDNIYATVFQGDYTVHPDNKKFAFATSMSGSIQFFDFTPESISLNTDLFFYHPSFTEEGTYATYKRDSKMGFPMIDSDSHYVYALYAGNKTLGEHIFSLGSDHILVYDWNGNPVKRYELEIPLFTFCLNAAGDKIYGVAFDPETIIVQYDLK